MPGMAGVLMIKCEIKYLVSHSRRTPDAHFHHTFKRQCLSLAVVTV